MNSLLIRQLKRARLDPACAPSAHEWFRFLDVVSRTYQAADEDRYTLERSLMISSAEMQELYEGLRASSESALAEKNLELEKNLAFARYVQEAVFVGLLVVDPHGTVLGHNRRFSEMWGVPSREVEANDQTALIERMCGTLRSPDTFRTRALACAQNPQALLHDEVTWEDGRVFVVFSGPVCSGDSGGGACYGRVWCFRDVSEQRRLDRERLLLSERMASMGRLVASVAHEINNPLAYVIANVWDLEDQLAELSRSLGDHALREQLRDVKQGLDRVSRIVRDLRMLSRNGEDDCHPLAVRPLLESSIAVATNLIRHRARLVRRYHEVPLVLGNEGRLGQVLLNLLVNAADAIVEGRVEQNSITIATRFEEPFVVIKVEDTGAGIEPELLERIFDPFFTTKAKGAGTGLGLAICKGIVESYGGSITVRSRVGQGTTFTLRLPKANEVEVDVMRRTSEKTLRPVMPGRICVIDDEAAVGRSIARILGREHQVRVFSSARVALAAILEGERFDVIVCDLTMPDMTGWEFYAELQRQGRQLEQRVIFLTGGALSVEGDEFLATVENRRLYKPFDVARLRRVVVNAIHRIRSAPPGPF